MATSVQCSRESTCTGTRLHQRGEKNSVSTQFCVWIPARAKRPHWSRHRRREALSKIFASAKSYSKNSQQRRNAHGMRVSAPSVGTMLFHTHAYHTSRCVLSHARNQARRAEFAARKFFAADAAAGTSMASQRRQNARITPTDSRRMCANGTLSDRARRLGAAPRTNFLSAFGVRVKRAARFSGATSIQAKARCRSFF